MKRITYELEAIKHRVEANLRIEGAKLERAEAEDRPNRSGKLALLVFNLEACVSDLTCAIEFARDAGI